MGSGHLGNMDNVQKKESLQLYGFRRPRTVVVVAMEEQFPVEKC